MPPSPLTSRSPELLIMCIDDEKDKKKDYPSSHRHSRFSSCSKCVSSQHSDDYKRIKGDKWAKTSKVLKAVNNHVTAALYFNNSRLPKQSQDCNSHVSCNIVKWAKKMDLPMKSDVFKTSDTSYTLFWTNSRLLTTVRAATKVLKRRCSHTSFASRLNQLYHI